jgi:hypothetical protein
MLAMNESGFEHKVNLAVEFLFENAKTCIMSFII